MINKFRKSKLVKILAVYIVLSIIGELAFPTIAYALTSGPTQPEFTSFEPVVTTNLVNEFTGDFTYNIPVLEIPGANDGGYQLSVSYHSGGTPEEEASWVGYGWTLNPGSITRNKRGFPDDWNGENVKYWNKMRPNRTISAGPSLDFEASSVNSGLGLNASIRYNNYKGFGYNLGLNFDVLGITSLGYNLYDGDGSFSWQINPGALLSYLKKDYLGDQSSAKYTSTTNTRKNYFKDFTRRSWTNAVNRMKSPSIDMLSSNYGLLTYNTAERPTQVTGYEGSSWMFTTGVIPTATPLQLGFSGDIVGNYTTQTNTPEDNLDVYGYMYTANATNIENVMDYYVENESTYSKLDLFLGRPFNNADNYVASGEGIGGGFKLYNRTIGHFRPNYKMSKTKIINIGGELEVGFNIGGGSDIGSGEHRLHVGGWGINNLSKYAEEGIDSTLEPNLFRFTNDLGGSVQYGNRDLKQAKVVYTNTTMGFKACKPVVKFDSTLNDGERSRRSSYIGYNSNSDMGNSMYGKLYRAYSRDEDLNAFVNRNDQAISDQIGEFSVVNEAGMRYTYGLPVYSKNEKNLQYSVYGSDNSYVANIYNNYLAYMDVTAQAISTKIGEERDAPYATMHLLTEITSPDYIDRTLDGPSDDDFGGYTKFVYDQLYGTPGNGDNATKANGDWYKWRIPYRGLSYNPASLSDPKDDMASVIEGEKEIYYLDTIYTKTHYAVFLKSDRYDGMEAESDRQEAATSSSAKGTKKLQKLDEIRLYAKSSGELIKSVHFKYNYDAYNGIPNSDNSGGKLTLEKIWFEYEGVVQARIAPYRFEYEYPGDNVYPSRYADLDNYGNGLDETPDYSNFNIDPWGNYQANGQNRYDSLKTWVNQDSEELESLQFDPAAWQLKVIKLPTGGEIHVQYEQDDYCYVQDQEAHVMAPLSLLSMDTEYSNNVYYIDHKKIGISDSVGIISYVGNYANHPHLYDLRKAIKKLYMDGGNSKEKMYFKFLYSLRGTDPDIGQCNSDYITGYANVEEVGIDQHRGLYVVLGGNNQHNLPKIVCKDFVKKERVGNLYSGNCLPEGGGDIFSGDDIGDMVEAFAQFIISVFSPGSHCKEVNYPLSYLRIPTYQGKLGGGVRVKRLLLYDKGMHGESNSESLYGSEYIYKFHDGNRMRYRSSGVATNEPAAIREENALVKPMARMKQSWWDKVISGKDRKQSEGPIGESIMPAASVGYSKVIIKNIHGGKTTPGFTIKQFYTCKNYPVKAFFTPIDRGHTDYVKLPLGILNVNMNNQWISQGYKIEKNNMHGQIQRIATYTGNYEDIHNPNSCILMASERYRYFTPGSKIPVKYNMEGPTTFERLGVEMDLNMESRATCDIGADFNVEVDIDVGIYGIPPLAYYVEYASAFPYLNWNELELYRHVTTKVMNYPAIVKNVKTYKDGVYHETVNKVFDPYTGRPIITKTYDGFDELDLPDSSNPHSGEYTTYSRPASFPYEEMRPKSLNEKMMIKPSSGVTISLASGTLTFAPVSSTDWAEVNDIMDNLCDGDQVFIDGTSGDGVYHLGEKYDNNKIKCYPTSYSATPSGTITSLTIYHSGHTNQLTQDAGKVITYAEGQGYFFDDIIGYWMSFVDQLNDLIDNPGDTLFTSDIQDSVSVMDHLDHCEFIDGSDPVSPFYDWYYIYDNSTGKLDVFNENDICESSISITPGEYFNVNHQALALYYNGSQVDIKYFTLCCDPSEGNHDIPCPCDPKEIIHASATTYDDEWGYSDDQYFPASGVSYNDYEKGKKGKWRPSANYVYRDEIVGMHHKYNQETYDTLRENRNYNQGTFFYHIFDYDTVANNVAEWVMLDTITKYSPNGNALESQNILEIKSAAKFGYSKTLPYLVAKNSDYGYSYFESFENTYSDGVDNFFEDYIEYDNSVSSLSTTQSHSGEQSLKINTNQRVIITDTISMDLSKRGLVAKMWVKTDHTNPAVLDGKLFAEVFYGVAKCSQEFEFVAQVGEWALYEAIISDCNYSNDFVIRLYNTASVTNLWVDDVRIQPIDAQVNTYVYDVNTLRLITSFDDQHFGLFYQYNEEGKLVRKLKETERGMKTIKETQYHTPETDNRPSP